MIEEYRKRRHKERENRVQDYHIMDNYIQVLTYLHQTNRFQTFFDPAKLKMMLIKPASMEHPQFFNQGAGNGFNNTFLVGCHLYQQIQYKKAAECFRKVLDSNDKTLQYEVRFNMGACLFKMSEFKLALRQFTLLMNEQKGLLVDLGTQNAEHGTAARKFVGRDRRLYFNRALCEL